MCVKIVIGRVGNCKNASRIQSWWGLEYVKRRDCPNRYIMIE